MSIVDAIKKLREQLTGEPGKGASITDAINDLTEGLTGEPGVGASISDAISNLADHADDISGGGGGSDFIVPKQTITITDSPVPIQADFSSLSGEGYLCGGYLQEEDGYLYPYFTKVWYDWTSEHTLRIEMPNLGNYGATIKIVEDNGTITAVVIDSMRSDVMPGTYTFGIAPNFLI